MAVEIEGRIPNINPEEVKTKLLAIGAKPLGFYNFRRYVFDPTIGAPHRWLRLRTDGNKTTLTFKELSNDSFSGTEEWEIEVSDFETTLEILEKTGIKHRSYQENTRDEYEYHGAKLSIDHWPKLGYLLEIEVEKEEDIYDITSKLGFNPQDIISANHAELYQNIGIDVNNCDVLKF